MRLKVDVIVTSGEPAALAAKRATKSIPIFATELGMDPVKAGLVASPPRPGANVTGLATLNEEMWQKRLSIFKRITAKVSRLVVLWNPANPGNASCADEIKAVAPSLGLQVTLQDVRDANALERALAAIAKDRPDALVICWDSMTLAHARRIAEFALAQRLPALAPIKEFADAGMIMTYGISLPAHRRRSAYFVDKLLKGGEPSAFPVEQAAQFDLVFNVATAKVLGISIPQEILLNADALIQ